MKTWSLFGCLVLASCQQFGLAPADTDNGAATTTSPKNTASPSPASSSTTAPVPSSGSASTGTTNAPASATLAADLWPLDPNGNTVTIPVCFESSVSSDDRAHAKSASEAWTNVTMLKFTGWDDCPAPGPGPGPGNAVRIATTSLADSHVEAMGREAAGQHVFLATGLGTDDFESDVLHELGHVVGLAHEDLSDPVSSATCNAFITVHGITNDLPGLPPPGRGVDDPNSIMSRCRTGSDPVVTTADALTVLRLYGVSESQSSGDDDDDLLDP